MIQKFTSKAYAEAGRLLIGLVLAMGVLFVCAHPARADLSFGSAGSGAGQTSGPQGIAVDNSTGDVFVADTGNKRIDVFAEGGSFLRAFGWDVAPEGAPGDTASDRLEICTTACQAGSAGAGAGQFGIKGPTSIAVDNDPASSSYHDLYVYDNSNARVQRFTPGGAFVLTFGDGVDHTTGGDACTASSGHVCGAGVAGLNAGQFNGNVKVATGLAPDTVYVADVSSSSPFAHRVQSFDSSGSLTGNPVSYTEGTTAQQLASDAAADLYLGPVSGESSSQGIKKYDPATPNSCIAFCTTPLNPSSNIRGLAVDPLSGRIFVADMLSALVATSVEGNVFASVTAPDGTAVDASAVNAYDSSGDLLSVVYGDRLGRYEALAARHTANGDFYAVDTTNHRLVHVPLPPVGPVVLPDVTAASSVGNTTATVRAYVNPEDNASTAAHLEYVTEADFQASGWAGAESTPEEAIGSDFFARPLEAQIGCPTPQVPPQPECLAPETTYRLRAVATDGTHTTFGSAATFTTRAPFDFGAAYASEVGTATATLSAQLNPLNIPATGRIQYVDEATYQADRASGDGFQHATEVPAPPNPPFDFGNASDEMVTRSVAVEGLRPDSAYRFRLVGSDPFATRAGPEGSFRTFAEPAAPGTECSNQVFRSGTPSAFLPDCRAYEMVSPPEKGGADLGGLDNVAIFPFLNRGSLSQIRQATPAGARITYSSPRPFAEPEAAPWASQYLATRTASGWGSENITPPSSTDTLFGHFAAPPTDDLRFQAFGSDLCAGFLIQDTDTALAPADNTGYGDLYRRDNCAEAANPYTLLSTAAPTNQPPGYPSLYFPRFQGFSADGQLAAFRATGKLATSGVQASSATVSNNPIAQLYLAGAGSSLRLISVLPDGTATAENSSLGTFGGSNTSFRADNLAGALSADGSRAYWTSSMYDGASDHPKLYLRINAGLAQSPISAGQCTNLARACTLPVSESVDPGDAVFWGATADGAKALFSFSSGPHAGELYTYDLAKALAGEPPTSQIASGLTGVVGSSADLSRVYLVSSAALDAGATAGHDNLYLHEDGQGLHYIADLTTNVAAENGFSRVNSRLYGANPFRHFARVSPDGAHAAFFAFASPTGAENADAQSGAPDGQVYLYDAGADRLSCVSCNPSGARPEGRSFEDGTSGKEVSIASYISGAEDSLYFPRNLSADGKRLFFTSYDALLPADTNGAADVYRWQAPGSGECDTSDAEYFEADGGCLSLISTGKSPDDSEFVDASTDGSDAFFTTRSQLYGADGDSLLDIYDARVGGGFAPPAAAPTPCDLAAGACEGAGTATPKLPGAGSAAFQGPPDPQPAFKARCSKGRREVRRHGKVRCLKRHRHRAAAHKRRTQR
jgi:NHL repeat-containing protein